MKTKYFLIDIDGVLFPSEEAKVAAFDQVADQLSEKFDYPRELMPKHPMGRPTSETLLEWIEESNDTEIRSKIVDQFIPIYKQSKIDVYSTVAPYPEAEEFINSLLEADTEVCFVTTLARELVLVLSGRFNWFARALQEGERLVALEDVALKKPNPDPYLRAASMLGVEPGDCCVIEDSNTGVRAGLAAEVHTVYHLLKWQGIEPDLVKKTTQVTDLMQIIKAM